MHNKYFEYLSRENKLGLTISSARAARIKRNDDATNLKPQNADQNPYHKIKTREQPCEPLER